MLPAEDWREYLLAPGGAPYPLYLCILRPKYYNAAQVSQQVDGPCMMFETNTATCGDLSGVSHAFVTVL